MATETGYISGGDTVNNPVIINRKEAKKRVNDIDMQYLYSVPGKLQLIFSKPIPCKALREGTGQETCAK